MSTGVAPAEGILRLVGRPPFITGTLLVANESDGPAVLESQLTALRADDGTESRATLHFVGQAAPKARARVPLHLVVDAFTPPGVHRGEVVVGGARQPVEVRILESGGVSVAPNPISLRAPAGSPVEAELVVTNDGNVSRELPATAVIWFEESAWIGRALVVALREAGAEEGAQTYLDRVVRELRRSIAGTATVAIETADRTLAPGAQTVARISATLPAELVKGRSYVASFALGSTAVRIRLEVNGNANSTKRRPA